MADKATTIARRIKMMIPHAISAMSDIVWEEMIEAYQDFQDIAVH
jgi:hypothetical protein